jgi:hypothetical protein
MKRNNSSGESHHADPTWTIGFDSPARVAIDPLLAPSQADVTSSDLTEEAPSVQSD